ncbi:MAG: PEGA domain-containing protein [Deltaproteobacteria bacterium]|nr:PEGA domain-containing protein [Deltaproteobacteria bacterium]
MPPLELDESVTGFVRPESTQVTSEPRFEAPPASRGSVSRSGSANEPFEEDTPAEPSAQSSAEPEPAQRPESLIGSAQIGEGFEDNLATSLDAHIVEARAQSVSKPPPAPRPKRRVVSMESPPSEDEAPKLRLPSPEAPAAPERVPDSPLSQLSEAAPPSAANAVRGARETRFRFRKGVESEAPLISRRERFALVGLVAAALALWGMQNSAGERRVLLGGYGYQRTRPEIPTAPRDETPLVELPPPPADPDAPRTPPKLVDLASLEPPPPSPDPEELAERDKENILRAMAARGISPETGQPQPVEEDVGTQRKLKAKSTPAGATVLVAGRVVGSTPLDATIRADGPVQVQMTLDGYKPWSARVRPNSRGQYVIDAHLPRQ